MFENKFFWVERYKSVNQFYIIPFIKFVNNNRWDGYVSLHIGWLNFGFQINW
jgi:hypothetical protein